MHGGTDAEIVERLRTTGFDRETRDWRLLAAGLCEYGYGILVAWGVSGQLPLKAARLGGRGLPTGLCLSADDAHALAAEVLLVSLERFRTKSLPAWDPDFGASLNTWFIGRCLLDIGDVYASWHRREKEQPPVRVTLADDGRYSQPPDEAAEARIMADQILGDDPYIRQVLEMHELGYSYREIAAKLSKTPSAVRSRVFHLRQRVRKEVT